MFLFFTYQIEGDVAHFDETEMRHCIQVLRHKPGDTIQFADGRGIHYSGDILSHNKSGFKVSVKSQVLMPRHPAAAIHIGIAPTKNTERFEWFLEKATELGVSEITPLICANSERRQFRPDRSEKIMLSAMKQCFGAYLPRLNAALSFAAFIENQNQSPGPERFIAHVRSEGLPHLLRNSSPGNDVVLLIGPEGDFSWEEIHLAEKCGFQAVSLGPARLRTETAGLAAVHILNLKEVRVG